MVEAGEAEPVIMVENAGAASGQEQGIRLEEAWQ
jgi:hypothetical protein